MSPRRRRRSRRRLVSRKLLIWIGSGAAVAVLVPVITVLVLIAMIDANAYKARLETSLRTILGRDLQILGALSVSASLSPKLEIDDVVVPNMPGGSRGEMVRIEHMTVELASWALLTGELAVERIALLRPDILFETDATGRANWRAPPAVPAKVGEAKVGEARQAGGKPAGSTALLSVHIRDGRITWRDGASGASFSTEVRRMSLSSASIEAPVIAAAELYYGRQRVNMSAQTGPWARLLDLSAKTPWGVFVNFESAGAKLTVAGALTRPNEFKGYSLRVDAAVPDLGALGWLWPVRLPPLRNVGLTGRLLDTGGELPDISSVLVQAGFSNLDRVAPGLSIDSLRIEMQRMSEPVVIGIEGAYASAPLRVVGSLGAPALLLAGAPGGVGYNVDLAMEAGGAALAARGSIAEPGLGKGMDITLGARIPDLGLLGPLIGMRLPQLKTVAFSGVLADGQGGWRQETLLRNIVLTLPQGDLGGEIALSGFARPRVRATVKAGLVDADGLIAAWGEGRPGEDVQPRLPGRMVRIGDLMATPPASRRSDTVIPDTPLAIEALRSFDADIRATIDEIRLYGGIYRDLGASLVLSDGRLVAGPVSAEMGGGRADLRLGLDARQKQPVVTMMAKAQGVDITPYLAGWGLLPVAVGKMDLDADLRATGATWHELAAGLDGHVALMLGDGVLDTRLARWGVAEALRGIRAGEDRVEATRMEMRCLSLGLEMGAGKVTLAQAGIDSVRFFGTAGGAIDLGTETMALRLRPMLRTRQAAVAVPLRMDGGWLQPGVTADPPEWGRAAVTVASDACPASPFLRRVP